MKRPITTPLPVTVQSLVSGVTSGSMAKGPSKRWMSMRALLVSSMRGAEVKSAEWRWSERSRKPSTETCRAFSRYFFSSMAG